MLIHNQLRTSRDIMDHTAAITAGTS